MGYDDAFVRVAPYASGEVKILLTGASGFIGKFVRARLSDAGHEIIAVSRSAGAGLSAGPALDSRADWMPLLRGVDAVVHAAAVAHKISSRGRGRAEYFEVNCQGTLSLAGQAARHGVKRFIFLSTIGVLGDATTIGKPFGAASPPDPFTDYAHSKWEAEIGLERLGRESGLPWTIIRPPLVYGVGAPGNVGRLLRAIKRGVPIPLGAITNNRRSFVSRANLADLISCCLIHPQAISGRFLVSDDQVLSTADFVLALGRGLGREARLVRLPPKILALLLYAKGGARMSRQLLGNLEVDASETKRILGWTPRLNLDTALHNELTSDMIR